MLGHRYIPTAAALICSLTVAATVTVEAASQVSIRGFDGSTDAASTVFGALADRSPHHAKPINYNYSHAWTAKNGTTYWADCQMGGFNFTGFAPKVPKQFVRKADNNPTTAFFLQLPEGNWQPWHNAPAPQFVFVIKGNWWVRTSDGVLREFGPGQFFYEDNVEDAPSDTSPKTQSGTVGAHPCDELILQVARKPEVDNPCPF